MSHLIPVGALAQHVIALGKTGAGKSSAMRFLVEGLLDDGRPITIIDPKGDWWGIKSAADGKRPGYPVVIFGGEHADVPINAHAGAAVAELVATGNRPSLIDLGGWMVGERTRFFIEFASTLFKHTRGARHLVIDEVHNFAPQGKIMDVDAGKMLHWANRLASEGRGKGLTILAASQRPQKVHKDFLTGCETLIAMRVIHKLDRDAIKDWIDGCADPAKGREVLATLAGMKRGEAWVWSPEIEFGPERVKFPMFSTFDSFKPQAADAGKLKGWAEVDLEEVRAKLAAAIEQAQANDPAALKRRISELERQARAAHVVDTDALLAEYNRGFNVGYQSGWASCMIAIEAAQRTVVYEDPSLPRSVVTIHPQTPRAPETERALRRMASVAATRGNGRAPSNHLLKPGEADRAAIRSLEIGTGGKRRIMIALAQYPEGMSDGKLSILTGLSSRSGTWSTYIGSLRTNGFIEGTSDRLRITKIGLNALGPYEQLPVGAELVAYWRERLGGSGKRAIFDAVVETYPDEIAQDVVAAKTGLSPSSGTWSTYLGNLRTLGLITGRANLRASDDLFG